MRALPDSALGTPAASGLLRAGLERAGIVRAVAASLRSRAAVGGDLRGQRALRRHLLSGRQLAVRGPDSRACQTRPSVSSSWDRQKHLSVSLDASLARDVDRRAELMNRAQALAILQLPREQAVSAIIALGEKAERWEHLQAQGAPSTLSGMQPVYLKPSAKRRAKTPGRTAGHPGAHRPAPAHIDEFIEHALTHCPHCDSQVGPSIRQHTRYIEEIPPVVPHVSPHPVHGHWCAPCQKIVTAPVAAALPHSTLGIRFVVYTAWLHYFVGVSVGNCVKIAHRSLGFSVSPGGLTLAWQNLAARLEGNYDGILHKIRNSA